VARERSSLAPEAELEPGPPGVSDEEAEVGLWPPESAGLATISRAKKGITKRVITLIVSFLLLLLASISIMKTVATFRAKRRMAKAAPLTYEESPYERQRRADMDRARCQENLMDIGRWVAFEASRSDMRGALPDTLEALAIERRIGERLICPGDISLTDPSSGLRCSYRYVGRLSAKIGSSDGGARVVIAYDKRANHERLGGRNVLLFDGFKLNEWHWACARARGYQWLHKRPLPGLPQICPVQWVSESAFPGLLAESFEIVKKHRSWTKLRHERKAEIEAFYSAAGSQ